MAASDRQTPRPGMGGTRPLDVGQSAPSSKENKTYKVVVNGLRGEEVIIDLCNTEEQMQEMTVLQLKEKIIQRVPGHDDVERLRLIFTDRMLGEDSTLLCSYGIQHKSMIHLVMKLPGGGPSSPLPPPLPFPLQATLGENQSNAYRHFNETLREHIMHSHRLELNLSHHMEDLDLV